MLELDPRAIDTPAYVVDLAKLRGNLELLADVQARGGVKILLALKGFAMWSTFGLVRRYLAGVTTSSPHEARLGREEFDRGEGRWEVHAYAPAYSEADIAELLPLVDHVVFNSVGQWHRHRAALQRAPRRIECGLRLNPRHSEVKVALYDPCAPGSRLGATADALAGVDLAGLDGLHFHTLCELGSDALERTVDAVVRQFDAPLRAVRWINLGGGHHITRPGYDIERLLAVLARLKARYPQATIYLEPGEAIALGTGVLVTRVLDLVDGGGEHPVAILDTSATAHMPDVLEMPYRPEIRGAGVVGQHPHAYRLGGLTCLAGDVIGDYSFPAPLRVGDALVFGDMAHYTMVKNTTFNGVRLPDIATHDPVTGAYHVVRRFGYEDYRGRLS